MPAELLERYLVARELRPASERWCRRVVNLFISWSLNSSEDFFSSENVSRFLQSKQVAGRSAYYRKSLRNGLVALLRFKGDAGKVRPVKLTTLAHETWSAAEVSKLLAAVDKVFRDDARRTYWRTIVQAAYMTGLSQCDLHKIERRQIGRDGTLLGERTKTGRPFRVHIPSALVAHASHNGPAWPLSTSGEYFRRTFRRIVKAAGLKGTFKTLRKSSGTSVERLHPGQGHKHLANSRAIFERHYWFEKDAKPLRPEPLAG